MGKYGRSLGWLYIGDAESSLNEQMIDEGYAWSYDGGTKQKNFEELREIRRAHGTLVYCRTNQCICACNFAVSAAVVGGGTWLYLNKDAMIENARGKIAAAATEAISGALPGMLDAAMPELPGATGGAIPMGEGKRSSSWNASSMNFDQVWKILRSFRTLSTIIRRLRRKETFNDMMKIV